MGRLEKQIIIGALALVGVLLTVVVLKGLKPRDGAQEGGALAPNAWGPEGPPKLVVDTKGGGEVIALDGKLTPAVDKGGSARPVHNTTGGPPQVDRDPGVKLTPIPPPPVVEEPPVASEPWVYTVKDGEVLGGIAQRQLGSVRHMQAIQDLNPGLVPDRIVAGDSLLMPPLSSLRSGGADSTPTSSGGKAKEGQRSHTVVSGDSLSAISKQYYGNSGQVGRIVRANPSLLRNEDTILGVGWVLVIPDAPE